MTDEQRLEDEEIAQGEIVQGEPATQPAHPVDEADEAPADESADEPVQARADDAYLRLAADFDNYRKRIARDQASLAQRANERLLNELLPVLDDLERALGAAGERDGGSQGQAKLEEGVRLVLRSLQDLVERSGLQEIATEGAFDPHVHEALLTQPGEGAATGEVLQVLQKGYKLGDRVVRPARVIVAE